MSTMVTTFTGPTFTVRADKLRPGQVIVAIEDQPTLVGGRWPVVGRTIYQSLQAPPKAAGQVIVAVTGGGSGELCLAPEQRVTIAGRAVT